MVVKNGRIPTGQGHAALPIKGIYRFKHNLPIILRECQANAMSYNAERAHAVRIMFEPKKDADLYLLFMHDGKPFDDLADIMGNGLTPNMSGGEGCAYQGNGLTYCASYAADSLNARLIIASRTKNGFYAASAHPDFTKNEWVLKDEPGLEKKLRHLLGDKWFESKTVFYLFRLPDFERDIFLESLAGSGRTGVTFSMDYINNLTFLAPSLVGAPKLTVSESIFYAGRPKRQTDKDEERGVFKDFGATGHSGSWHRNIVSMEEYGLRYVGDQWSFKTDLFTVERDGDQFSMRATITVRAYPGIRSKSEKGLDNRQWLGNLDDGEYHGRKYKKGGGSGMGTKPGMSAFLSAPIIWSLGNGDPRFDRFKDHVLGQTGNPKSLFASLGLPYNDKQPYSDDKGQPFATINVEIDALGETMTNRQTGAQRPCSIYYWSQAMGRRPDFLFDSTASQDILNAACNAAGNNVPPPMRDWFRLHFPTNHESQVPLGVNTDPNTTKESNSFLVYDLLNGGGIFDRSFHANQLGAVAIWSKRAKRFISDIMESPITRGVEIKPCAPQLFKALPQIKAGYDALHLQQVKLGNIAEKDRIPTFSVDVCELYRLEDDGAKTLINTFEYEHECNYFPTRGVHVCVDGTQMRLGHVEEVPPRPSKPANANNQNRKKAADGGSGSKLRFPYDQRDVRVAVRFVPKTKQLLLNLAFPLFAQYYNVPDQDGTKSQKLLNSLYETLQSMACNLASSVEAPVTIRVDQKIAENAYMDESGSGSIYDDDSWDYLINENLKGYLATNQVRELLNAVDDYRSTQVAA